MHQRITERQPQVRPAGSAVVGGQGRVVAEIEETEG